MKTKSIKRGFYNIKPNVMRHDTMPPFGAELEIHSDKKDSH